MVLNGIPISDDQCISDSLQYINSAFQTLSTNVYSVSASTIVNALSAKDSSSIDLGYNSSTKTLTATLALTAQDGERMTYSSTLSAFVGARLFPTWNSTPQTSAVNNQIGNSGFLNYQRALTDVIRNNRDIVGDRLTTPNGTYPYIANNGGYPEGILMMDGRVYCVPYVRTEARIYDPVADTVSTPAGTFSGTTEYAGAVLLPSGKVFLVPFNATQARIYDPVTNAMAIPTGSYGGSANFYGGVLLPNGKVFCLPYNSTRNAIYDPTTDSLTFGTVGEYPGSSAFSEAILLPDGKVFCVPNTSTTARIYDPATNSTIVPIGTYSGSFGGALLPNGKIFCYPLNPGFTVKNALIYDPVTNTQTISNVSYSGVVPFGRSALLANGKVFMVPYNNSRAYIYDYLTDTISIPSGTYPANESFSGAILLSNGRLFMPPANSTTARIYDPTPTYQSVSLDINFVTSPFVNKY